MSIIGYGTKVEVNDGASDAQAEITGVTDISPPADKQNYTESKIINAASRRIAKVQSLIDDGEFSLTIEYSAAMMTRLLLLKAVSKTYRITFPDDKRATFTAELSHMPTETITSENIVSIKPTFVVTGAITWDTAS